MVKTLNSVLKGTGFESYQDNVRFVLEQENLLQLLQSTQVRMGTWPFGRFVLSKTKNAKTPDGCGVQCVMCLLLAGGVIVCKRLEHCYAVDKRYINAIFTFTFYQNDKWQHKWLWNILNFDQKGTKSKNRPCIDTAMPHFYHIVAIN